ncbi:MAG: biotin transporter BioY [Terrimesophilobacter sp.]
MSSLSLAMGHPTLVDRVLIRALPVDLVLIAAGAAFTALVAQFQVPSWPSAIPVQTLAVLLVGSFLGCLRGALSMMLYVTFGALGLPVFGRGTSGMAVLQGPSGGYLLALVLAAALTGWVAQRSWDHTLVGATLSFLAGTAVVFALSLPWYAVVAHLSLSAAAETGLYPFVIGGIIKSLAAALIVSYAWRKIARSDLRQAEPDFPGDSIQRSYDR